MQNHHTMSYHFINAKIINFMGLQNAGCGWVLLIHPFFLEIDIAKGRKLLLLKLKYIMANGKCRTFNRTTPRN